MEGGLDLVRVEEGRQLRAESIRSVYWVVGAATRLGESISCWSGADRLNADAWVFPRLGQVGLSAADLRAGKQRGISGISASVSVLERRDI